VGVAIGVMLPNKARSWSDCPCTPHVRKSCDRSSLCNQVTQAARMKWNGAQRAGSRLSQQDDYYALLEVPRDATPEHIKKQVCQSRGQCLLDVIRKETL
jgi:hypothetical protein